jgi:hypothetical protein
VECSALDAHTWRVADAPDLPPARQAAPRSVVYARALLTIQACLWAMVVLPAAAVVALNIQPNVVNHAAAHVVVFISVSIVVLLLMVGLSAGSAYLAANLRSRRTSIRQAAVGLEAFMACFGLLLAYLAASTGAGIIAGLPVTAGLVGTMLSATAAAGLLGKAARNFTRSAFPPGRPREVS